MSPDPFGGSSAIDHCPDDNGCIVEGVVDGEGKNSAELAMVVLIDAPVDSARDLKPLDIATQSRGKILAETRFLDFVKPRPRRQILQCVVGDLHLDHGGPKLLLTSSQ